MVRKKTEVQPILSEDEMSQRRKAQAESNARVQDQMNAQSASQTSEAMQNTIDRSIYESIVNKPQEAQEQKTPSVTDDVENDTLYKAYDEAGKKAVKSYDDMIADLDASRAAEVQRINDRVKDTKKASTFAGAAEAASAIANLVGTMAGASNQTWTSPQTQLQSRIYELMNKRDEAIKNYSDTMATIRQKKSAFEASQIESLAKLRKDITTQRLSEQRLALQAATEEARNAYYQARQLAIIAKGTKSEAALELEAKTQQAKYEKLVAETRKLEASARLTNANAAKVEKNNSILQQAIDATK